MEGLNLTGTFAEFKELKNIDRPTMMSVLEPFGNVFVKQIGQFFRRIQKINSRIPF